MSDDTRPFDVPDPEAAGWKEDPDRPGYWLWDTEPPISEAPDDGKQYGRQSMAWTEIVHPEPPTVHWELDGNTLTYDGGNVVVGTENTEGAGLYRAGQIKVWETTQNTNKLFQGYGGATEVAHITAQGNARFSANVYCGQVGRENKSFIGFNDDAVIGRNSQGLAAGCDLGSEGLMWKDGHFSGTIVAGSFEHADGSDLFTETDPVFSASPAAGITSTNISNWNTAHGWGNHASAGYATESWVTSQNYSTYTGADAVKTSGNQTVGGTKTFTEAVEISGNKALRFSTHGGGWNMTDATWIRAVGKAVYVANTSTNSIAAAGDVVAYYSDERLKDVQGPIENPLDKVDAIDAFYYTHNDLAKELGYEGDEVQVGVSAQSVKAVMPEVVCRAPVDMDADGGSLTGEDYMTVKYERLVPLLLESIKQLTARVKELESGK